MKHHLLGPPDTLRVHENVSVAIVECPVEEMTRYVSGVV